MLSYTASIVLECKPTFTYLPNTHASAVLPPPLPLLRRTYVHIPIPCQLAVGCPVDGPSDRDANRNNVDDLSNWLVNDHRGHFLVWNVSDHRSDSGGGSGGGRGGGTNSGGPAGPKVSRKLHQRLLGQVLDVPWCSPNRRCYVPSIRHLLRICYSIKVSGGWTGSGVARSRRGPMCGGYL